MAEGVEIKRLSEDVSRRISTATVVASLEGAVRQLVDNSLDAGATSIEVKAHENGFNSVEVIDNGSGIDLENHDKICKPHHTSKLIDLTGFQNLTTLGFRGQALNALCALGSVTIHTRSASSLLGTKMVFDHRGEQVSKTSVARQVGTTITVESLFETLPVRRKEFGKSSKREFTKVLSCLQCFSFSRPDVKFICSNTVNGKRSQLICTTGNGNVKEIINNIFGGRLEKNKIIDLRRVLPDEEICSIYGLDSDKTDDYNDLLVTGYISSCEQGFGRSSPDRQFIYINKRPIDYAKVSGTVNEVYKQYNKKQYPTLILFIEVPPSSIDVNVTPDKRTVFFDKERQLLALIRSSLKATFEETLSVVDSTIEDRAQNTTQGSSQGGPIPSVFDLLKDLSASKKRPGTLAGISQKRNKPDANKTLHNFSFNTSSRGVTMEEEDSASKSIPSFEDTSQNTDTNEISSPSLSAATIIAHQPIVTEDAPVVVEETAAANVSDPTQFESESQNMDNVEPPRRIFNPTMLNDISRGLDTHHPRIDDEILDAVEVRIQQEEPMVIHRKEVAVTSASQIPPPVTQTFWRTQQKIKFSKNSFMERMQQLKEKRKLKAELASQLVEFSAAANNQSDAEAELSRRLNKQDLEKMTIVGQFNKAFIISRLDGQLFIVDQHAADEKYNFERFQKKAKIETQRLIAPQLLDFGRVQEMIIHDNLSIFENNGFAFEFREDDQGCSRAYLTGFPVIYSRQFDKRDIDEMISVIREFPGQMYRPAKTRAIFASRACRKSVMVGMALTTPHMQRIVHNLGGLKQPWNCPHGRPTLRHLLNLDRLQNRLQIHK